MNLKTKFDMAPEWLKSKTQNVKHSQKKCKNEYELRVGDILGSRIRETQISSRVQFLSKTQFSKHSQKKELKRIFLEKIIVFFLEKDPEVKDCPGVMKSYENCLWGSSGGALGEQQQGGIVLTAKPLKP